MRTLPVPSDGGAGAFFSIASIILLVLAYFVVNGIVEAISRLIP